MRTLYIDIGSGLRRCWINADGYYCFKLNGIHKKLHRYLAETYLPNPKKLAQVNHKDGNKLNNSLDNLEWVTQQENLHHAMDAGLHPWGRTAVQGVKEGIKVWFKSQAQAARRLGISQANIARCLAGKGKTCGGYTWSYA